MQAHGSSPSALDSPRHLSVPEYAPGHAKLDVEFVSGQSTVVSARAFSPLKLLMPRPRGDSVWVYTSSFGGGLVGGDQTRLDLRIGAGTRCCISTQASTKIYRNPRGLPCGHTTRAEIEQDSLLVLAPDPVQAFAGSSYTQRQEFRLATDAGLVLVDWFTSGRAACGERWAFNRFQSRNEVRRLEAAPALCPSVASEIKPTPPLFLDSLLLDATQCDLAATHRTGRFHCFALLLVLGTPVRAVARQLLDRMVTLPVDPRASLLLAASPVQDGVVLRIAGEHGQAVALELHRCLSLLRDQIGDDPWGRKW
jgi:urease accessory protein